MQFNYGEIGSEPDWERASDPMIDARLAESEGVGFGRQELEVRMAAQTILRRYLKLKANEPQF
jgi:hypothetical protein